MASVRESHEGKRGCGYRKGGGYYLIGGSEFTTCGKLPYPVGVCQHCGEGMKFFRGFRFFNPQKFIDDKPCIENYLDPVSNNKCVACPMSRGIPERAGIMWVGNKFYSPDTFLNEALKMGISKRLPTIPRELLKNIGNVRVYLVHPKACQDAEGKPKAGFFTSFVPKKIEYVVKGNESEGQLSLIEKRGIELVKVVPIEEQPKLTNLEEVVAHHSES